MTDIKKLSKKELELLEKELAEFRKTGKMTAVYEDLEFDKLSEKPKGNV